MASLPCVYSCTAFNHTIYIDLDTFVDTSGWRLYYTDKLRKFDGYSQDVQAHWDTIVIPPRQPDYKINAFCSSECLKSIIPKEGIKVFAVYTHTHLTGRKIIGRHFRNGTELEPIVVDNHYDFNYQVIKRNEENDDLSTFSKVYS